MWCGRYHRAIVATIRRDGKTSISFQGGQSEWPESYSGLGAILFPVVPHKKLVRDVCHPHQFLGGNMSEHFKATAGTGIAQAVEDPSMYLVGRLLDDATKWVRLPDELGGRRVPVLSCEEQACPVCKGRHLLLLLAEETAGGNVGVLECGMRFLWVNVPRKERA
jgi:hypothetical protein